MCEKQFTNCVLEIQNDGFSSGDVLYIRDPHADRVHSWRICTPVSTIARVRCPQPWPRPAWHCTTAMRGSADGVRSARCSLSRIRLPRALLTNCMSQNAPCCVAWMHKDIAPHAQPRRLIRATGRLDCSSHFYTHPHLMASAHALHFWHVPQLAPGCAAHTRPRPIAASTARARGLLRQRSARAVTPLVCVMPSTHSSAQAVGIAPTR